LVTDTARGGRDLNPLILVGKEVEFAGWKKKYWGEQLRTSLGADCQKQNEKALNGKRKGPPENRWGILCTATNNTEHVGLVCYKIQGVG